MILFCLSVNFILGIGCIFLRGAKNMDLLLGKSSKKSRGKKADMLLRRATSSRISVACFLMLLEEVV